MWFQAKPANVDIIAILRETYERQIALLQEQLSDARADAQRHCDRADAAADQLIKLIGLPAISNQGKIEATMNAANVRTLQEKVARENCFDDMPFDGQGVFTSREEAEIN